MATTLSGDYTLPDAELVKTRFPVFAPVADPLIEMLIDEMSDHVDERWRDKDYQPAIMYLVAHRLTLEGEPGRALAAAAGGGTGGAAAAAAAGGAGAVKMVRVDDVDVSFYENRDQNVALDGAALSNRPFDEMDFTVTQYGRRFLQLRQRNHGGPRVFHPGA